MGKDFPNPFGSTLCAPFYGTIPLRIFLRTWFYWLMDQKVESLSEKIISAEREKEEAVEREEQWQVSLEANSNNTAQETVEKTPTPPPSGSRRHALVQRENATVDVISDSTPLLRDLVKVITSYLSFDDVTTIELKIESLVEERDEVLRWEGIAERLSLAMQLLTLVACVWQFGSWLTAEARRAEDGWYHYNGFLMAVLQLSGAPWQLCLGWLPYYYGEYKEMPEKINYARKFHSYWFHARVLCNFALLAPFVLTHGWSLIVFAPIWIVFCMCTAFLWFFLLPIIFALLPLCCFLSWQRADEWLAFARLFVTYAAVEASTVVCFVASASMTTGTSYAKAINSAVYCHYCKDNSNFALEFGDFSWREWLVLLFWLF